MRHNLLPSTNRLNQTENPTPITVWFDKSIVPQLHAGSVGCGRSNCTPCFLHRLGDHGPLAVPLMDRCLGDVNDSGYCAMWMKSPCYRCQTDVAPTRICPPLKKEEREGRRLRNVHSCSAPNCIGHAYDHHAGHVGHRPFWTRGLFTTLLAQASFHIKHVFFTHT